jgi:hypothetical protein
MVKQGIYRALLVGIVLGLSLPLPAMAGPRGHAQPRIPHHNAHERRVRHQVRQHRPAPRHHHHRHRVHHYGHHVRRPRSHLGFSFGYYQGHDSGVSFGIVIGSSYGYGPYSPGPHRHGPHCTIVVEKYAYHHAYPPPIWHLQRYVHDVSAQQPLLIVVAPEHGEVYVDGRYLPRTVTSRDRDIQFPVGSGQHVVQLDVDGTRYTRQVEVKAGSTTVIEAYLRR